MMFRGRRRILARVGTLAVVLSSYLLSLAPAAAGVIYCISNGGHSGFELVAGGDVGCASCCHDTVEAGEHDGLGSATDECTDVALSLPEDTRGTGLAFSCPSASPLLLVRERPSVALPGRRTTPRDQTALSPPRSAPAVLVAFTVLTI